MANIKSQIKRNLQNERRRLRNKAARSEIKTRVKRAVSAAEAGTEESADALRLAVKRLDKAAAKGIIHKNQAAHQAGLAVGRLVLVDHALRGGPVQPLDGQAQRLGLVLGPRLGGRDRVFHAGLQLGAHGLVAHPATLVLKVALDLALDVGHGRARLAVATRLLRWPAT
jgi:small subunit ribosomal protein S20